MQPEKETSFFDTSRKIYRTRKEISHPISPWGMKQRGITKPSKKGTPLTAHGNVQRVRFIFSWSTSCCCLPRETGEIPVSSSFRKRLYIPPGSWLVVTRKITRVVQRNWISHVQCLRYFAMTCSFFWNFQIKFSNRYTIVQTRRDCCSGIMDEVENRFITRCIFCFASCKLYNAVIIVSLQFTRIPFLKFTLNFKPFIL